MTTPAYSTLTTARLRRNIRRRALVLALFAAPAAAVHAQLSFGINAPGVSIGINFSDPPQLVRVPGYPAYYAPQATANLFFYDGLYWIYLEDSWYAGSWYNGPWTRVRPAQVPLYVLRIPVRYYRQPPSYFRGWRPDAPPRWNEHWGNDWARDRRGWDQWDRRQIPAPAPLPTYQRRFSGDRYPAAEQQPQIRRDNYRYQPRDATVRQHFEPEPAPRQAAPAPRPEQPQRNAPAERRHEPPGQSRQPPGQAKKEDRADDNDRGKGKGNDGKH